MNDPIFYFSLPGGGVVAVELTQTDPNLWVTLRSVRPVVTFMQQAKEVIA